MIQYTLKVAGAAAVAIGVLGISFGSFWASPTLQFLSVNAFGRAMETSVPFLPILLITVGAILLVRSRR